MAAAKPDSPRRYCILYITTLNNILSTLILFYSGSVLQFLDKRLICFGDYICIQVQCFDGLLAYCISDSKEALRVSGQRALDLS